MGVKYCKSLLLILVLGMSGCVSVVESIKEDKVSSLQEDVGYLMLSVNTNTNLSRFRISGEKALELRGMKRHNESLYFLAAVPAGRYSISAINSGYFERYQFGEEQGLWSFEVKPDVISYVGELKVRKKQFRYSTFELVNRSSTALEYIEEYYPNILDSQSMEFHGPGEDRFFEVVFKNDNNVISQ